MRGWRGWALGSVAVLVVARLCLLLLRTSGPSPGVTTSRDPTEVSERKTREADQRAKIATMLDASPSEFEGRIAFDEARRSAAGALHAIGSDATAASANGLAYAAMDLERSLREDVTKACARRGTQKLEEAAAALSPDLHARFDERIAIARRSVDRACKLAPVAPVE